MHLKILGVPKRWASGLLLLMGCYMLSFSLSLQAAVVEAYAPTVQKVYIAYYGRPADTVGLDYWTNQLSDANGDLAQIIESFANSTESQGLYGSATDSEKVNAIYQQLLGRDAEAVGLQYYVDRLASGASTHASIMMDVLNGATDSDQQTIDNKLTVATAFTNGLDTTDEVAAYNSSAASAVREWLAAVTSTTNTGQVELDITVIAGGSTGTGGEGTGTDNGTVTSSGNIEITDQVFTARSADCADYVNDYDSLVSDITRGQSYVGDVVVSNTSTECTFASNSIPNHDFNDSTANFANDVAENAHSLTVSRSPALANSTTSLTQDVTNGIMLNGVVLDIMSAGCYRPDDPTADRDGNVAIGCSVADPWLLDPLGTSHKFGADAHNAHTQPGGLYHYHGNPKAMFDDNPGASGSPVIGFAADGFPIYGSYFLDPATNQVRKAESGYALKSGTRPSGSSDPGGAYDGTYVDDWEFTNSGDLDACNGMTVNGQYGYYAIDEYPWVMACFSGTPHDSFNKGNGRRIPGLRR